MNQRDLTYGLNADSQETIRDRLSDEFGFQFELRYSDYLGGDYFFAKSGTEEIRIQWNLDGDDIAEEEYPELRVLVLVDGSLDTERWQKWANELNAVLIRETSY